MSKPGLLWTYVNVNRSTQKRIIHLSVSAKSLNDVRLCVGAECKDVEKQIKLGAAPIGVELCIY